VEVAGNSFRIPNFLSATSPNGLVVAMLRNNLKYGMEFRYFDIQFAQGKWIVWFNVEMPKRQMVEAALAKAGV
jgi:hypothetical protein